MRTNSKHSIIFALAAIVLLLAPVGASADWGFSMGDDGWNPGHTQHYDNITKIEFFIPSVAQNAGITWSGEGVTNLSSSSWSAMKVNPTYVLATGTGVGSLFWTLVFSGTAPSDFRLDYLVYTSDSSNSVFAITMNIANGVANFTQGTGWVALGPGEVPGYDRNPVPLPPSAWLLGVGLVGAFAFKKKIAGNPSTPEKMRVS
jgi:hypothetical protein